MTPKENNQKVSQNLRKIAGGALAFPLQFQTGIDEGVPCHVIETGICIRDYFAAKAMQGLLSTEKHVETSAEKLAAWSYQQADAMLLERSKNDK